MTDNRHIPTRAIQAAVKGREPEILRSLEIGWEGGNPHIHCPYPSHGDKNPSWRWDEQKARAFCSCIEKSHSIFDVAMAVKGIDFEGAKVQVAQLLGREDLIQENKGTQGRYQAMDAQGLLNAPPENRDDDLPIKYLAHRLGVAVEEVPRPSTPVVGLKQLGYFDPPTPGSRAKPKLVGHSPCAVFETASADGRTHAHRIYLAADGAGKAELGNGPDGHPREPKKSARTIDGVSRAGCAVFWGDPAQAPQLCLAEGIETAAAIAFAFRDQVASGEVAVAAAISATGVEAFRPYPATQRVTVCADRDEAAKPNGQPGSRRGEQAARKFAILNYERLPVSIALPGTGGETIDWLDVLCRDGLTPVQVTILYFAPEFIPTKAELVELSQQQSGEAELTQIADTYPLPVMDNIALKYARTPAGKVKVHKVIGTRTDLTSGQIYEDRVPVATPFGVSARLRHADQHDAYGLRCVVQDMNGQPRAVDFDRAELPKMNGSEIRSKLFGAGLRTEADGEQIAVQCLKAADPGREIVVYHRPGWHDLAGATAPAFICPDGEVIGAPQGVSAELASPARLDADVAVSGSLEVWKDAVGAAVSVRGCPHWTLGAVAGFVATLISLTGLDTCGINLSGQSSSGKSTAQRLAASAWSTPDIKRPGLAQSARATGNATEVIAQGATGTVLPLDDLVHVTGKELASILYMLAGGVGKQRMRSDATLRTGYTWSTFAIFSCECSLEEKIRGDGAEWRAGMAVRFPDVDVTGVNRQVDAQTLNRIDQMNHNYGHAGPAFVRGLIDHRLHLQTEALRDRISRLARQIAGNEADSARIRAALPFALLLTAGELAKAFGLIPEHTGVADAVRWAWERFEKSTDALALDPEEQALANLRRFIAERWDVTIKSTEVGPGSSRELVGWFDNKAVYIPKDRIFEATGKVLKASNIGAMLHRRGLLAKKPERDRYTVPWVPKVARVRSFALRRDEFRSDEMEPADEEAARKEAADD
jgi:hypothetical protein